jgi:hypothetical protein
MSQIQDHVPLHKAEFRRPSAPRSLGFAPATIAARCHPVSPRLRHLLKVASRSFGLVAISCREEEAEPAPPLTEEGSSS